MTIERSHGKARPTLPRSSDLQPDQTVRDPSEGRDAQGRAALGNQLAIGRGWKSAVRKAVEGLATSEEADRISRDAWTVYLAVLRDLASTGPLVRVNAAGMAREFAYAGYYDAKALEAGLDTDRGMRFAERAGQHRQRAERLSVTTKDHARATTRKPKLSAVDMVRAKLAKEGA